MSEVFSIETRSRSRSKTPNLLSSENGKHDKKGLKKIPTISLIEEEDDALKKVSTSQAPQSSRVKRQRRSENAASTASSNIISEALNENFEQTSSIKSSVTTFTTVSQSVTRTVNGNEESSESITKSSSSNHDPSTSQNNSLFNNIFNTIKTSTPILSSRRSRQIVKTRGATESKISEADHLAYKEYKDAGEYWNKYPKTDYTYSELSPHRRELGNGVVGMPNMSRHSLEKYQTRVENMIQNNPNEESFLRRKFLSKISNSMQKNSADLQYDSSDEIDLGVVHNRHQVLRKSNNVVTRFFLMIITMITSVYSKFTQSLRRTFSLDTNESFSSVHKKQESGIFSKIFNSIKQLILLPFSKFYLLISTILCVDTWILYSHSESRKRKYFLLLLLFLLPFLLLAYWLLSDEASQLMKTTEFVVPNFHHLNEIYNNFGSIRDRMWNFDFNLAWLWLPLTSIASGMKGFLFTKNVKEDVKMAIDEDKLQMLMAYIDRYIDTAIGKKFKSNNEKILKETNEKVLLIIADNVKHSINQYHYQLSPEDIEVIVGKIKQQFESELNERENSILSKIIPKNEEIIVKKVKETLNLKPDKLQFNNENVNLDFILQKVLNSDKLLSFINDHLQPSLMKLDHHESDIQDLKSDFNKFKSDVVARFSSLDIDIKNNHVSNDNLVNDFMKFKLENDQNLQKLLLEIDQKMISFGDSHFSSIDASVRKNLLNILGFNLNDQQNEMDEASIRNWINSMFVAKSDLEKELKQIEVNGERAFKLQLNENAGILMNKINEEIKKQITISFDEQNTASKANIGVSGTLTEADVLKIVKDVLAVYDADKTGLADFALESAGGQVLSTRCTENYQIKSAEISIFGIPLWYPSNTPRTVISPSVQPGECWAFQGFPGFLVVKLNNMINISGFTMEHISQSLAPNGIIDSAPNNFSVWGLTTEMDKDPVNFGNYHYSADENAASLQYFPVQNREINQPYQIIELRVESNHGNPSYTCLYRFRVHGNVVNR
ncbi:CLUMA_CG018268, isoform A [Clunio marinus]|uniref:CLUMA_CG018268, isoform A n=1 Tax=Clunio marinus TaxID=568069 RepID=A0A1J1IZ25_9DIPT|nr:CLUMA_CG018268, isoform A [Clunio marinus]